MPKRWERGRALMGTCVTETQSLAPFTLLHNALLSAVSLVLLVALAAELASEYAAAPGGAGAKLWAVWCDPPPRQFTAGRLYFIYYCNYVVKVRRLSWRCACAWSSIPC